MMASLLCFYIAKLAFYYQEIFSNKNNDELLNLSIELAQTKKRVFVVSIPDYGVTPFSRNNAVQIKQELNRFNEYMKKQCEALDIPFINITSLNLQTENNAESPVELEILTTFQLDPPFVVEYKFVVPTTKPVSTEEKSTDNKSSVISKSWRKD